MIEIFEANWQNFLLVIVAIAIIARLFLFIVGKFVLALAGRTKTEADDILVEKSKNPLFFIILVLGLKYAINTYYSAIPYQQQLFNSLIVIFIAQLVIVFADVFFIHVARKFTARTKAHLDDQIIDLLHKFSSIVVWAIAIVFILQAWNVEVGPLIASLGIAGVAIAFALQTSLANIFGGISLILDRNIKVGDVLNIDNGYQMGKVLDIGLRSTKIRTFDGELLIMPNGKLSDTSFINVAMPNPKARVKIPFGVEYGADVAKVRKLIADVIKKNIEGLDPDEDVSVKFLEMGDSALLFTAYFYMNNYGVRLSAKDKANELIYNILNKHKIGIPFPQMDVHMKKR